MPLNKVEDQTKVNFLVVQMKKKNTAPVCWIDSENNQVILEFNITSSP